jgi:hypothetical protein
MSQKPNCYKCIHRGTVPGDAHSCCKYPGNKTGMFDMFIQPANNAEKLNIKADPHGVRNGWFMWPVNFDPVWLLNCDGFEEKENPPSTEEK